MRVHRVLGRELKSIAVVAGVGVDVSIVLMSSSKRCDISTTTNDFNSHPSTWCTRIQVDSESTTNLYLSLKYGKDKTNVTKGRDPAL